MQIILTFRLDLSTQNAISKIHARKHVCKSHASYSRFAQKRVSKNENIFFKKLALGRDKRSIWDVVCIVYAM